MKITKSQLEEIISEEISTLSEEENLDEIFKGLKSMVSKFMGGVRNPKERPSDTKNMAGSTLNKQSIIDIISAGASNGDPDELGKALNQVFKSLEEAGVEANTLRTVRKVALEELKKFSAVKGTSNEDPNKTQELSKDQIAAIKADRKPKTRDELMRDYNKRLDALKEGKKGESVIRTSKLLKEGIEDLRKQTTNLVDKVKSGEMKFKDALQTYALALIQVINDTLLPNTKKPGKVAEPTPEKEEKPPADKKPAEEAPTPEKEEKPTTPDKKPAQDKKKKEAYIGDIRAALNQIENFGEFNPKKLLQSLGKMRQQVQSSLKPINKALKNKNLKDNDKSAIEQIGKEFKNNAISKVASAFDEAESYIRDYYKKVGFDVRLNESRGRSISKGAARVLLILLEKEIKEKKTLQDNFNDRGERLYEALMKKFIK